MGSGLHAQQLVTSLTAGLIAGIRTILGSASMVVLVMPNALPGGIAPALQLILTGGVVVGALVALFGSYPGVVAQVQDGPAVIIGVMATALAATMGSSVPPALAVLVVLASANVAAFAAGAVFFGLGTFRLGALMRFIPFPVIGGFLAGSGLLILLGAIPVLTGVAIPKIDLQLLSEPLRAARWLPGLAFGLLLLAMLRRYRHPLLVPGLLLAAVALYHRGLQLAGMTVGEAQAAGLLLGPFPDFTGLEAPGWMRLPAEGWSQVAAQVPTFASIVLVSVVALLLNASGLELATRSDLDINRELRAAGLANMASGLLGGAVGFHALSASLLGYRMGANSRVIGLASAALAGPFEVEGVLSHLASGEVEDHPTVEEQQRAFEDAIAALAEGGLRPALRHLANSGALLAHPSTHYDMVRPGLVLYGALPAPALAARIRVRPVMQLRATVLQVKDVEPGAGIGYGSTHRMARHGRIAVLHLGYAQGVPRALSNRGTAILRGHPAPIVGMVSMDHTTVDATAIPEARAGDEAILWGSDAPGNDVMSVGALAGTLGYELLTGVPREVPRIHVSADVARSATRQG